MSSETTIWERVKHFIAGCSSGVALVLAGHPFDTVKVRLQTGDGRFTGAMQCAQATIRTEGVRGLYRGATPPMVMTGGINAVMFGLMGLCAEQKRTWRGMERGQELSVLDIMQCGAGVGVVLASIVTPMELIKAKLQVQYNAKGETARFSGPVHCAKELVRAHGVKVLYQGAVPTMLHRGSNWAYFGGYHYARQMLAQHNGGHDLSLGWRLAHAVAAGSFAGTSFWLACYPIDVVKNRIQTSEYGRYSGMLAAAKDVYAKGGIKGFFRGFGPCLLRSVPANAAAFTAYELTMSVLPHSLY